MITLSRGFNKLLHYDKKKKKMKKRMANGKWQSPCLHFNTSLVMCRSILFFRLNFSINERFFFLLHFYLEFVRFTLFSFWHVWRMFVHLIQRIAVGENKNSYIWYAKVVHQTNPLKSKWLRTNKKHIPLFKQNENYDRKLDNNEKMNENRNCNRKWATRTKR